MSDSILVVRFVVKNALIFSLFEFSHKILGSKLYKVHSVSCGL